MGYHAKNVPLALKKGAGEIMFAYISRRLGVLFVILFGSSFILYNLAAISGDPLGELRLSREPNAQQQILALTRELNLDVPPPLRYFLWLRGVLGIFVGNADFGLTRTQQPVLNEILVALPITLRLVTAATIIAIILGITIGIVTALRQYSRFDYAMTFVSFLLYSLPIFWVAVLLKEYLAIQFNTFLGEPTISPQWLIGLSLASGIFWSAIISGTRKRVLMIFSGAFIANFALLSFLSVTGWFANPSLGPIALGLLFVGVAYAVTQLSTGVTNKAALHSSLAMAAIGIVLYYPLQWIFEQDGKIVIYPLLVITLFIVAGTVPLRFTKIDRGPIIRTSMLSAFIMGLLIVVDQLMQTWKPYMESDAVYFRPIPTIGQVNALLEPGDFWMSLLDALVHMFLPTLALLLISFAGYVRFSRGTLLEVLNQDYIRTARAKGLTERTVIMRHAFAAIIGGAIITERIFGWLGMGTLFNTAINAMDLNLLMGVFLLTGFLAVSANLVADLLYSALDPRIRAGAGGK
jgi:peptide/nickel transport system permease protein